MGEKMKWLKSKVGRLCVSILIAVMSITPVMAESIQVDPSDWAIDTIIEGQNYGIYPLDWHKNFNANITKENIHTLREGVSAKILSVEGVSLKKDAQLLQVTSTTKEEVLKQLFGVLMQFNYPVDMGFANTEAISFVEQQGIIDNKLNLNKTCTIEEAIVYSTKLVDYVYNKLNAGTKGYLFKVDGGKNKVYLLGSVHVADSRVYPFNEKVLEVYKQADVVGFEIDIVDSQDYQKFIQLTRYSDGSCLKDHVSKETYELVVECGKEIGLSEVNVNKLKPWYLSNYISTQSVQGSRQVETAEEAIDYGIDNYFYYKAYGDGKEIVGLESYELQAKMFDSFSDELQEYLLLESIYGFVYNTFYTEEIEEAEETNVSWVDLIKDGDIEGLELTIQWMIHI